jgi:hypothetical protein
MLYDRQNKRTAHLSDAYCVSTACAAAIDFQARPFNADQ